MTAECRRKLVVNHGGGARSFLLKPLQFCATLPISDFMNYLRLLPISAAALSLMLTSGCGGGGHSSFPASQSSAGEAPATTTPPSSGDRPEIETPPSSAATFTVSGTVTGLHGLTLTLKNNGADAVTVRGDGTVSFPTPLASGADYAVTTEKNPLWMNCAVSNGSGKVTADVAVNVSCTTPVATKTTLLNAGLVSPKGIAVDGDGNVYVADAGLNAIVKIDSSGTPTTFATGLGQPSGMAVDTDGNVYVANNGANTVSKFASDGSLISASWGGAFNQPTYIAVDAHRNVYVLNHGAGNVMKIDSTGVTTVLSNHTDMGAAVGLTVDADGFVYASISSNGRIDKIAPDGTVTIWRSGGGVAGITLADDGSIYAVQYDATYTGSVRRLLPDSSVVNLASGIGFPYFAGWIAIDSHGDLYATDTYNGAVIKLSAAN